MNWTLDQLKSSLSRDARVKSWIITQEHVQRRERYFMSDSGTLVTDQDRDVHAQNVWAKVIVKLPAEGRQGEITQKLFPSVALRGQLDSAIEAALQTDHQSWDLPASAPSDLPRLKTADPNMAEDLDRSMSQLTAKVALAVERKRATTFNSAELFLSVHDRETHLSNGLVHRASQSRIYAEAAYSMTKDGRSDEYLNTRWAVSADDLPIGEIFDETSERAERSLDVDKPGTGRYSVIVDAEVLATLLNGHVSQLSAVNVYNGLPFVKPGDELIPNATGDLLTITLDPMLDFGADTAAISEQGVEQKPLKLVDRNRVASTSTDKQYADYLGLPATSVRGNVVVEPGTLTHAELTKSAPRVIEILQFSGLFADSHSGTFSSEIRLARLFDNVKGTVTYLKGGSLSGSILQNFKGVRLSSQRVRRAHFSSGNLIGQGYYGPEHALLSDVSIVG